MHIGGFVPGLLFDELKSLPPDQDFECVDSNSGILRTTILQLDWIGRPYGVLNLGLGVKKIATKVNIWPKCHGTGKV